MRIQLIGRIIREYEREFHGGHGAGLKYSGWINDPASGYIVNHDRTDFFWLCSEDHYEVLFDTQVPRTKFLAKRGFSALEELHRKRNLFLGGPLEFTAHIGWGWHIPILGVTEIIGIDEESKKKTTLSLEEGILEEKLAGKERRILLPRYRGYYEKEI
jgi:hypothetical protein